jgi:fluoride exporter
MNASSLLLIALGGALGSVARATLGWLVPASRFPWGTLIVNVSGSLLIGWLLARFLAAGSVNVREHAFWVVGVCGGFTTFSTFSWQTFEQLQKGAWGVAAGNVVLSVVLCLLATWVGWRLAR